MASFGSLGKLVRKNSGGLKRLVGRAAPVIGGAVAGPFGAIGARALLGGGSPVLKGAPSRHTGNRPGLDIGDVSDFVRRLTPGGARGRGRVSPDPQTGKCPVGYHPAKDGNGCVRNRRTNVGNARALARALRRAEGFEKLARRTVNALRSGPKKFKSRAKKR